MSFPNWISDVSANKFTRTYMIDYLDLSGNLYIRNGKIQTPGNTIEFNDATNYINISNLYLYNNLLIYNPITTSNIDLVAYVNSNNTNITSINSSITTLQGKTSAQGYNSGTTTTSFAGIVECNVVSFLNSINNVNTTTFGYISGLTSSAQTQLTNNATSISTANSNITTLQTKTTNQTYTSGTNTTTWTGNVVFPATSIASTSINNTSFVGLLGNQFINGGKTFGNDVRIAGYLRLDGILYLNNGVLAISPSTLQNLQYMSSVSSNIQTQLDSKIGLGNNNTYTGIQSYNNAVNFNSQFYIASASPLIQIENGNTLRQWSSGTTGDTVMELAWDKGASTTGFSIQGGNDGTRGLFGLYFCTNVSAGTRIPIMYSKDTGTQANNVLTIASGTTATTNLTFSGTLNNVSSAVYGYISGLTSSAQQQLDNKGGLAIQNYWTNGNTFNGQLTGGYNAGSALAGRPTEFFFTGQRSWENGTPSNGDNVYELSFDTGFNGRGFVIQGGENNTAVSAPSRSIFGFYYRQPQPANPIIRTPILYGTDTQLGAINNTLICPSSLQLDGSLKVGSSGGTEITNTQLGYLSTLSANVQTSINSLATKLTDLVWTAGSPNKTSIVNTTETSTLTFSNTLNGISTGVFSYLSGVSSSIQGQLDSLSSQITSINSQITGLNGSIATINSNINNLQARTPVGSIIMYLRGDLGSPFLFCDGRELNRTTASALFAVIGTTYGAGDGSTTFNIPDMTAIFLRGYGNRTINGVAYASTTGSTLQIDAMEQHTHSSNLSGNYLRTGVTFNTGYVNGSSKPNEGTFPSSTGNVNTSYRTSNETRPINLPVYYYICAS